MKRLLFWPKKSLLKKAEVLDQKKRIEEGQTKSKLVGIRNRIQRAEEAVTLLRQRGLRTLSESELIFAEKALVDFTTNFDLTAKNLGGNWGQAHDALSQIKSRLKDIAKLKETKKKPNSQTK